MALARQSVWYEIQDGCFAKVTTGKASDVRGDCQDKLDHFVSTRTRHHARRRRTGHVSIRARHHWRAMRFAANMLNRNIFSMPTREPLHRLIW